MPGYCVAGTVGHKILNGVKRLEFENKQTVSVHLKRGWDGNIHEDCC